MQITDDARELLNDMRAFIVSRAGEGVDIFDAEDKQRARALADRASTVLRGAALSQAEPAAPDDVAKPPLSDFKIAGQCNCFDCLEIRRNAHIARQAPIPSPAGAQAVEHANRLREVAAILAAERIQGWSNPLVTNLTDAADYLSPAPTPANAGEVVPSAAPPAVPMAVVVKPLAALQRERDEWKSNAWALRDRCQHLEEQLGAAALIAPAVPATRPTGHVSIAHDGFAGDIIGYYATREGKLGVVVQQDGTRVVHVYGEKWLAELKTAPAAPVGGEA